jgi:nickel/cobalt exporter
MLKLMAALTLGVLLMPALLAPRAASAHPLGNFTVSRYSRIELTPGLVRLRYVVDMAEIPTFQEMTAIDTDHDGLVNADEMSRYAGRLADGLRRNLKLTINGRAVDLRPAEREVSLPEGQGGLSTLRFAAWYESTLPAGDGVRQAEFRDDNFRDRLGWKEIVVRAGDGVVLRDSTVPATDDSDELRAYPADMLKSPRNVREARFTFAPGSGGAPAAATAWPAARGVFSRPQDRFAALMTRDLSISVLVLSLVVAMGLGALHALGPGHGKTVVAAYLVGSRGTTRHAVFLGLTVTLTHTSSVFALGFVTLYLSEYILPEQLFPWLSFLSGAGITILGVALFAGRLHTLLARRGRSGGRRHRDDPVPAPAHAHPRMRRHHPEHEHAQGHVHAPGVTHSHGGHAHAHLPPGAGGGPVTWRSLLALGIAGGILPCPSALVVLLTALSIHRVGYGMGLIVAFSIGLAAVLTGIGLLLVHARGLFNRLPVNSVAARILPPVSAAIVAVLGAGIAWQAVGQM